MKRTSVSIGALLMSLSAMTLAGEVGSLVVSTSEPFICPNLEDAQSVSEHLKVGDNAKLKEMIQNHLCVAISAGIPFEFRSADGSWVQLSIPGMPASAGWSPRDRFVSKTS